MTLVSAERTALLSFQKALQSNRFTPIETCLCVGCWPLIGDPGFGDDALPPIG